MWGRRKLSSNIVLLMFASCLNISETIKIIYLFICLYSSEAFICFSFFERLNFFYFLTIFLKRSLQLPFFPVCASPQIFLAVQMVNDCLSTSAGWGCAIFANDDVFFHFTWEDAMISKYSLSTISLLITFFYMPISQSPSFFLKRSLSTAHHAFSFPDLSGHHGICHFPSAVFTRHCLSFQ